MTARPGPAGPFLSWAARLRFPRLLALTAALFVADLLVPDLLPFADEILLGLLTVLFGAWRKSRAPAPPDP